MINEVDFKKLYGALLNNLIAPALLGGGVEGRPFFLQEPPCFQNADSHS